MHGWSDRGPLRTWELGQPSFTVIEGGNLVMNYEAHLEADWLPGYDAYITSVYVWGAGDWSMICRTHTPRGRSRSSLSHDRPAQNGKAPERETVPRR